MLAKHKAEFTMLTIYTRYNLYCSLQLCSHIVYKSLRFGVWFLYYWPCWSLLNPSQVSQVSQVKKHWKKMPIFFFKKIFCTKRAKSKIPYDKLCAQQHHLSVKKIIKKYWEMAAELKFLCAHSRKQHLRTFWILPRNGKSWKT